MCGASQDLSGMFAGLGGCVGCPGEDSAHLGTCGGLDMLSTAVSEWGGPCFAEEGDWRRGSLALTCTEHPPSP